MLHKVSSGMTDPEASAVVAVRDPEPQCLNPPTVRPFWGPDATHRPEGRRRRVFSVGLGDRFDDDEETCPRGGVRACAGPCVPDFGLALAVQLSPQNSRQHRP